MNPDCKPGRFHWLDLAAVDAESAMAFYEGTFGWQADRRRVNRGEIFAFTHQGRDVASLYQLPAWQIESGVPSHWTPYIAVSSIDESISRAGKLGGRVIVEPFNVQGMARVALVDHPAAGMFGLWELAG